MKVVVWATAVVLSGTLRALATPILSGPYTLIVNQTCQPTLTGNFNSSQVVNGLTSSANAFAQQLVLAIFSPSTGKVKYSGFGIGGSVFLVQGNSNGATTGTKLTRASISTSVKYSNTATSIRLSGDNLSAIYGQIDGNGIAHTLAFMGILTSGGFACATQGMATRQ